MNRPFNFTDIVTVALCILCALSLQIQITLFASPVYLGLRINLTDLIVPFAGLTIFITLVMKKSVWPNFRMRHLYPLLAVLTLALGASLAYGAVRYGEVSQWALLNKFVGWFVLIAIMGMGAWIAMNARQSYIQLFFRIFLYFALTVLIFEITVLAFFPDDIRRWISNIALLKLPMAGFMANRNAYAFLFVTILAISSCFYFSKLSILRPYYTYTLFFLMPFFFYFNASRAAFITTIIFIIITMTANRKQAKKCLTLFACVFLGWCALFLSTLTYQQNNPGLIKPNMLEIIHGDPETHGGDIMRMKILKMAQPMMMERPFFGSGLGSTMIEQERQTGKIINLIDNTALWLLVETGLVGLILFAFFYGMVVKNIYLKTKEDDEFAKTVRLSMLYIILCFTIMSLLHELMYTRFLWFFLGLSLALPAKTRRDV